MSDETPRLKLPQLVSLQEATTETWNEALAQIDALSDLCLLGQYINTPPASPADGDAYLIGGAPSGLWTGYAYKIAAARDGVWRFYQPFNGLKAYVLPTATLIVFTASGWKEIEAKTVTFSAYTNFDNYIAANTPTKIQFNNDEFNDSGAFSPSANSFTAPAAGIYAFGFSFRFRLNAALPSKITAAFYKNGTELGHGRAVSGAPADDITTFNLSILTKLAASDTIDVRVSFTGNDGYIKADQSHFWGHGVG